MLENEDDLMAKRIKELRIKNNLSQEQLADKLGLQKSAIAKYENGRVVNIKRSIIANMAKIFSCSPSYIMGWDNNKPLKTISRKQSKKNAIVTVTLENDDFSIDLTNSAKKKTSTDDAIKHIIENTSINKEALADRLLYYAYKLYDLSDSQQKLMNGMLENMAPNKKNQNISILPIQSQKDNLYIDEHLEVKAAHANESATPEENKFDDDIMDDDSEWE